MLYQFMKKHKLENDIVAFVTDSICATKKVNLNSDKLGEFSLDGTGDDCYWFHPDSHPIPFLSEKNTTTLCVCKLTENLC